MVYPNESGYRHYKNLLNVANALPVGFHGARELENVFWVRKKKGVGT